MPRQKKTKGLVMPTVKGLKKNLKAFDAFGNLPKPPRKKK